MENNVFRWYDLKTGNYTPLKRLDRPAETRTESEKNKNATEQTR